MNRAEVEEAYYASTDLWYRRWGTNYRVRVVDPVPYNSKEMWAPPKKAKSKTAKGVYIQYVDKDTGKVGDTPSTSAKFVVNIDWLKGTWAYYADVHAEQEKKQALAKAQLVQASAEKARLQKVVEKHNERFKEAGVNINVVLQDYGMMPAYVSPLPGKEKPIFRLTIQGEGVLGLIAMSLLEDDHA